MKFSTPDRSVASVLSEPRSFPTIRTELPATIRGAYTSVGEIKRGNRHCENLLLTAEKFSAIAAWIGARAYPQAAYSGAWEKVTLNQFHDTISGTEMPPAVGDAPQRYRDVHTAVVPATEASRDRIVME
jgi:alpha-mannosidase